jgi:hypothetical protein
MRRRMETPETTPEETTPEEQQEQEGQEGGGESFQPGGDDAQQ